MKTRSGFVSNSSSSSFVVSKHFLTPLQIEQIKDVDRLANEWGIDRWHSAGNWHIKENEHELFGDTMMDNFQWDNEDDDAEQHFWPP